LNRLLIYENFKLSLLFFFLFLGQDGGTDTRIYTTRYNHYTNLHGVTPCQICNHSYEGHIKMQQSIKQANKI
jgi:hypothetical protein